MSTRAIIAIPVTGGYETCWCWYDAYPSDLGAQLRNFFKTAEQVKELISVHSFGGMYGKIAMTQMRRAYPTYAGTDKWYKLSNNRYLSMSDKSSGTVIGGEGENGFYKSIQDMLGEDINYVYVFEDGHWTTYKDISTYVVRFVDGRDNVFKVFETIQKSLKDAKEAFYDKYGKNFEHVIWNITEVSTDGSRKTVYEKHRDEKREI